jgi:hypothetical protein
MPRREKELLARDAKRDIGKELLQAVRDVKAGWHGAKYEVQPKFCCICAPEERPVPGPICSGAQDFSKNIATMGARPPSAIGRR